MGAGRVGAGGAWSQLRSMMGGGPKGAPSGGTHAAREPGSWAAQHSCRRLLLQLAGLRPPSALPPPPHPRTPPCRYRESTRGFGWYDWLGWFLPCFVWLREYNIRGWLLVSQWAGGRAGGRSGGRGWLVD
jgi:hypothetical protein